MNVELIYSIGWAFTNFSYIPISILMIVSGSYKKYRAFTLYIILMAVWGYADYLMGKTEEYIGIWRLYNFCNILNAYLFYIFSNEFSQKYNKKNITIFWIICVFFLFLNYYKNLLIPDSIVELTGTELFKSIWLYDFFVLYYIGLLMMWTLWIYQNFKGNVKIRKFILLACILTLIGDTYSFGTVYFEWLYNFPYIAYLICFLPYLVTYLIFRHRLFDARSTLLRLLQWGFIVGLWIIAAASIYEILWKYGYYPHLDIPLISITAVWVTTIFLLSKSNKIHKWFQLADIRELERGVWDFLTSSVVTESPEEVVQNINLALKSGLKIDEIKVINRAQMMAYPELSKELSYIPKIIQWVSLKEAKNESENTGKKIAYLAELESLGDICIPIYIEHKLAYFIILPEKKSQAKYTSNELRIINTMRQKIALSFQILEYNQILRDEVESQTLQINEQKKELEISYKKLETLDKEKDVFMNMAAHELRTPMTIIRWYADILLDGSAWMILPGQKKLLENILRGSQSLLELVNDLLDLSRIDAGKMELKYEICDIKSLTNDTYEDFKTLMSKKNMQFNLEESLSQDYNFSTDKAKLRLIYNNLISNAYKYTPENGNVVFRISTVIENDIPWLDFSVTDSGVGIPDEEIPKVFDRFASISTHNNLAATIQSTGLGLSIVKKIVVGMGWNIFVQSIVGQGTTFTVKLPYKKPLAE